ncbi:MAG: alpha/beta hydrolase fold domain-containing protein, partial [Cyanobacteria bacterium J06649_11]
MRVALCLLPLFVFSACGEDDAMATPMDTEEPIIELQFTNPPIDIQDADALFAADVPYDAYEDTKFDVFLPASSTPTGLVIFIHGGGFTGGDKAFIYTENYTDAIIELLNNEVAVATINYRLLSPGDEDGVLKSLNDSRRAIQYMRYIHNELNIDKEKVTLFGTSAGASTALWLATNDDFSDANSTDVALRESSRVKGIALNATQSSLDIET